VRLPDLESLVASHHGEFSCVKIHDESRTKVVRFRHDATPPVQRPELPDLGRLRDFYETFGSLVLYLDPESGDAARVIAAPSDWDSLADALAGWFDGLGEEERGDYLPEWIDDCLVIGETPCSGNYILMPTTGEEAGRVFEFDHDGFEFHRAAGDLVDYVLKALSPSPVLLVDYASHMRFVTEGDPTQWWIREMTDNRGACVSTD